MEVEPRNNKVPGKVFLTVVILVSYFGLGLVRGQEGVIFLDLLLILQEDIKRGSLLFLLSSPGFMIGSLVGGVLYDKFQPGFIYTASLVGAGIFSYVIPYCLSLPLMGFVMMVRSAFAGSIGTGGTFLMVILWKTGANSFIQLLHFTFALGALAIPLISEPFLATRQESYFDANSSTAETQGFELQITIQESDIGISGKLSNFTYISVSNTTDPQLNTSLYSQKANWTNLFGNLLKINATDTPQDTDVHYALVVTGSYLILASVPFVYLALIQKLNILYYKATMVASNCERNKQSKWFIATLIPKTTCAKLGSYVLVCLIFLTYGGVEKGCATFLMPYAVEFLKLDKTNGARLMSCFWAAFAASRFLGILIGKILSESKMLLLNYSVLIIGLCILFAATVDSYIPLWIASVVIGGGQAGIFPTSIAWINKNLTPVTGSLSAFINVSGAIGSMVHLPLLGYVFEEVSPIYFVYLTLGFSGLGFLAFVNLFIVRPKRSLGSDTQIETSVEI